MGNPISAALANYARARQDQQATQTSVNSEAAQYADDLATATYGELLAQYGPEVANARAGAIQQSYQDNLERVVQDRHIGNTARDTLAAGLQGVNAGVHGLAALGTSGASIVADAAGFEGASDFLDGTTRQLARQSQAGSAFLDSLKSDDYQQDAAERALQAVVQAETRQAKAQAELEAGSSPTMVALRDIGRQFIDGTANTTSSSIALTDVVAQGIGSLATSVPVAGAAGRVGGAVGGKTGAAIGTAVGVGASEASSTMNDAINSVTSIPHEELAQTSDAYQQYLADGMSPDQARNQLATDVGNTALAVNLPVASVIGRFVSKFEAAPITSFAGSSARNAAAGAASNIASQGVEETLQGALGQFSQNYGMQANVDPETDLAEGVGTAAAEGLIGGVGVAGTLGAGSGVQSITGALGALSNREGIASAAANIRQGASDLGRKAAETVSDVAEKAERATDPERHMEPEVAEAVINDAQQSDTLASTPFDATSFADSSFELGANENPTLGDAVTALATRMSDKGTDVAKMSDKDLDAAKDVVLGLFAKYQETKDPALSGMLNAVNSDAISNEVVKRMRAKQASTKKQSQQEVVDTLNIDPTSVNPESGEQVLNNADSGLDQETMRLLSTAVDISRELNEFANSDIQVETEGGKVRPTQETRQGKVRNKNIKNVANSISVGGFVNAKDKALRSINDFVRDIFYAAQHPNKSVQVDKDYSETGPEVLAKLGNLTKHMNNKVRALNRSADRRGANVHFSGLADGESWVSADSEIPLSPVKYLPNSKGSVAFAQQVEAEANLVSSVYSKLAQAFPEFVRDDGATAITPQRLNINSKYDDTIQEAEELPFELTDQTGQETSSNSPQESVPSNQAPTPSEFEDAPQTDNFEANPETEVTPPWDNPTQESIEPETDNTPLINEGDSAPREANDSDINLDVDPDEIGSNTPIDENPSTNIEQDYIPFPDEVPDATGEVEVDADIAEEDTVIDAKKDMPSLAEDAQHTSSPDVVSKDNSNLGAKFETSFEDTQEGPQIQAARDVVGKKENARFRKYIAFYMQRIKDKLNERLATIYFDKAKTITLSQAIITRGDELSNLKSIKFKATDFADRTTGKYDEEYANIAILALLDWGSSTASRGKVNLFKVAKDIDADISQMSKKDIERLAYIVPVSSVVEEVTKTFLKLIGKKYAGNATIVDSQGAAEGFIKEVLAAFASIPSSPIKIAAFKTGKDKAVNVVDTRILQKFVRTIPINQRELAKSLFTEEKRVPSIGTPYAEVSNKYIKSSQNIPKQARRVVRNLQNSPFYFNEGMANLVKFLGSEFMTRMLGGHKNVEKEEDLLVYASKLGKNQSIETNFADAMQVVEQLTEHQNEDGSFPPLFFKYRMTKVGRYSIEGINPQNNKILREMVSPAYTTVDMTQKEEQDNFWLAVAQNSEMFKTNKVSHAKLIAGAEEAFRTKYGAAIALMREFLNTGQLDRNAFAKALGSTIEMVQLNAIFAVASLDNTEDKTNFFNPLYYEIDGVTDGPGNMMVHFSYGEMTEQEHRRLAQTGFFLGKEDHSLNDAFEENPDFGDLYIESVSDFNKKFEELPNSEVGFRLLGNLTSIVDKVGDKFQFNRNAAKQPTTAAAYGATDVGTYLTFGTDIVKEIKLALSKYKTIGLAAKALGYPQLAADLNSLFGSKITNKTRTDRLNLNTGMFSKFMKQFAEPVGTLLFESVSGVMGESSQNINRHLISMTANQFAIIDVIYDTLLEEAQNKAFEEAKKNDPSLKRASFTGLTHDQLKEVNAKVNEIVGTIEYDTHHVNVQMNKPAKVNTSVSSTLNGHLRTQTSVMRPTDPRSRIIAYSIIGRGDAANISELYKNEQQPDSFQVYDGVNVSTPNIKFKGKQINQAVLKNWDKSILDEQVKSFKEFLQRVEPLISQDKSSPDAKAFASLTKETDNLEAMAIRVKARKEAYKEFSLSVDHMAGAEAPFTRKGEQEFSIEAFNRVYNEKLDKLIEEAGTGEQVLTAELVSVEEDAPTTPTPKQEAETVPTISVKSVLDKVRNKSSKELKLVVEHLGALMESSIEIRLVDKLPKGVNATFNVQTGVIETITNDPTIILHELVHATTFGKLHRAIEISETKGLKKTPAQTAVVRAVAQLNKLMQNTIKKLENSKKDLPQSAIDMIAAIKAHQTKNSITNRAAALNEFMAWVLTDESNAALTSEITATPMSKIAKYVREGLSRLFGNVPTDVFKHVLWNTVEITKFDEKTDLSVVLNHANADMQSNWGEAMRARVQATAPANSTYEGTLAAGKFKKLWFNANKAAQKIHSNHFKMNKMEMEEFKAAFYMAKAFPIQDAQLRRDFQALMAKVIANSRKSSITKFNREFPQEDLYAGTFALAMTNKTFRDRIMDVKYKPELNTLAEKMFAYLEGDPSRLEKVNAMSIFQERDFFFKQLELLTKAVNAGDTAIKSGLSEAFDLLAKQVNKIPSENQRIKTAAKTVQALLTPLDPDQDRREAAGKAVKDLIHLGNNLSALIPIREFIAELIGSDGLNTKVFRLLDKANKEVDSLRESYRTHLPEVLKEKFPDMDWAKAYATMANTDIGALDPDQYVTTRLLARDNKYLNEKIKEASDTIKRELGNKAQRVFTASKSLVAVMVHDKAHNNILPNATAINTLLGDSTNTQIESVIDEYISLIALKEQKKLEHYSPKGASELHRIMRNVHLEQKSTPVNEAAKLNYIKGYLNEDNSFSGNLIIARKDERAKLERAGYKAVEEVSETHQYFFLDQENRGQYNQGAFKYIKPTYMGVDAVTGNIIGTHKRVSQVPSNITNGVAIKVLSNQSSAGVTYHSRLVPSKKMIAKYLTNNNDLSMRIGYTVGRMAEEKAAVEINKALLDALGDIYFKSTPQDRKEQFIDITSTDDPIYAEAYDLMSPALQQYGRDVFNGKGIMVKKDHVNAAFGYRQSNVMDYWTGRTRAPKPLQHAIKATVAKTIGFKGLRYVNKGVGYWQQGVATAKDLILIRSLVVPALNLQSVVLQLSTRGVETGRIVRAFPDKLKEISEYTKRTKEIIKLEIEDKNKNAGKINAIKASLEAMSIWPLVQEGEFKSIYNTLADEDIELGKGNIFEWIEQAMRRQGLDKAADISSVALINKSTQVYKISEAAVKYGDFLAKSVYYDYLIENGVASVEALEKVSEEFINFSIPPGRLRSMLEKNGLTWFLTFKIKALKVALDIMRNNPFRALTLSALPGEVQSPLTDNLLTSDSLPYSIGPEMLFDSPQLHPLMGQVL